MTSDAATPGLWDGLHAPARGEPIRPAELPELWSVGGAWRGTVAAAVRTGRSVRVRQGVYASPTALASPRSRVLAEAVAVSRRLSTTYAFSHTTAALLAGLWVAAPRSTLVEITQPVQPSAAAHADPTLRRHCAALPDEEVRDHLGLPVTSVERTTVDCLRHLPFARSLAVADSALVIGADRQEMDRIVAGLGGRRGIRGAREVLALASGRVGSPAESLVRAEVVMAGLPAPSTLVRVETSAGTYELDAGWEELKVGIEVHGRAKYASGADPFAEAVRRERFFEAGWLVVDVRTGQPPTEYVPRIVRAYRSRA